MKPTTDVDRLMAAPVELQEQMLTKLDPRSLALTGSASKWMRFVSEADRIWRPHFVEMGGKPDYAGGFRAGFAQLAGEWTKRIAQSPRSFLQAPAAVRDMKHVVMPLLRKEKPPLYAATNARAWARRNGLLDEVRPFATLSARLQRDPDVIAAWSHTLAERPAYFQQADVAVRSNKELVLATLNGTDWMRHHAYSAVVGDLRYDRDVILAAARGIRNTSDGMSILDNAQTPNPGIRDDEEIVRAACSGGSGLQFRGASDRLKRTVDVVAYALENGFPLAEVEPEMLEEREVARAAFRNRPTHHVWQINELREHIERLPASHFADAAFVDEVRAAVQPRHADQWNDAARDEAIAALDAKIATATA